LEASRTDERRKTLESYIETLQAAKAAIADPNFGLVLVHWPVPHPPGIYSRRKNSFETNDESSYLDNLKLVDQALGELRGCMEDADTWDDTIVLVSSDHWWRTDIWRPTDSWTREDAETAKSDTDHRVPFLLKLVGQKKAVTYEPIFNNVLTGDLLHGLLGGEISSPDSVAHWLDQHRTIGESPYRFNLPQ
jgi:arylsulfatase A-like enzyme